MGWEALIIYTVLAVLFGRHTVGHLGSVCTCSQMPDSWQASWPFTWFPYALTHGLNPWYTHAIWNPPGFDVAGGTTFPLPAIVFWPVTAIWGPLVSANAANLCAPVLTAWATYHLCRYVSKDRAAALIGGASVGFGAYVIQQMWSGHIFMTMFAAPQFATLAALRYVDGAIGRRRVIVELTVCLVAQLFTSSEVFATMTLFAAVLFVTGYATGTKHIRDRLRSLILPIVVAYGVTVVLSADYLYWILKAPKYAIGIGSEWPTALVSYVIPNPNTWIGGSTFSSAYQSLTLGIGQNAYIGVPLILISLIWLWSRRRLRVARFLAAATAISVLWTLGSTLWLVGKPTIWMPYRLLSGLPVFNLILEDRTAVFTELLVAVMLTLWLADRRRRPVMKWIAGLVAVVCVLPNLLSVSPAFDTETTPVIPPLFATSMYKHYIARGATVMPIAWGWGSSDLVWQARDDLYYKLANGYFILGLPSTWTGSPIYGDLYGNTPHAGDGPQMRTLLVSRHIDDVVVAPANIATWKATFRQAGMGRPIYVGGMYLYRGPWRAPGARRANAA
jgi:hypothetical protein